MVTAGLSEDLERRITAVIRAEPINSSMRNISNVMMYNDIIRCSKCGGYQRTVTS